MSVTSLFVKTIPPFAPPMHHGSLLPWKMVLSASFVFWEKPRLPNRSGLCPINHILPWKSYAYNPDFFAFFLADSYMSFEDKGGFPCLWWPFLPHLLSLCTFFLFRYPVFFCLMIFPESLMRTLTLPWQIDDFPWQFFVSYYNATVLSTVAYIDNFSGK